MRIIAIIQARMSSTRFPGKVLHEVAGKPLLQYLLERLDHCRSLSQIVVATSDQTADKATYRFCRKRRTPCHRGPLHNVAERFRQVLDAYPCDGFVRVSADSPLLDPRLVDRGVTVLRGGEFDLVTNVWPRTYPHGQSVEVLRCDAFRRGCQLMRDPQDLEHVTRFFYRNPERFRIHKLAAEQDRSTVHLAVDNAQQMDVFSSIVKRMNKPHWQYGLKELLALHDEVARTPSEAIA